MTDKLSPDARSAINRENRSRHGMRASAKPLAGDDRAFIQDLTDDWMRFFRPVDPMQRANVERGIHASVLQKRGERFYEAALQKQIREARHRRRARQSRIVAAQAARLRSEPEMAVLLLKESASGCRYLIKYWNSICIQFDRGEHWFSQSQCDDALRLLGLQPDDGKDPNVYNFRMMNYGATPGANEPGWAWWLARERIPDEVLRSLDGQMLLPEECRDTLRNIVTKEREALAALEIKLRSEIEAPNHDEAPERATILKGTDGALYDRYFRTQTAAYHKATKAIRELHEKPLEPAPPDGPDPDPHEGAPGDAAAAEPTREPPVVAAAAPEPTRADSRLIVPTSATGPVAPQQGEPQGDAEHAGQAAAAEPPGSCPAGGDPSHPGLGDGLQSSMAGDGPEQRPLPEPGVPGGEAVAPQDMQTAVAVPSVDLAPPPPRATLLVEAARHVAAQATVAGPAPTAASEAAAEGARLAHAVPQTMTQVVHLKEDMTSQSAEAKAPKETRFDPGGAVPGDGQRPGAGCQARVRDPPGH
jgi:hypothetical protein